MFTDGKTVSLEPNYGEFKSLCFSFLQACPILGLWYDSGRELLSGPFHNQEASAEHLSKIKDALPCLALCDPMDCSSPGTLSMRFLR